LQLEGDDAVTFDVSSYIKDHDHLERIVVNGFMKSDLETKIVRFDTRKQIDKNGDYICEEKVTKLKPYIGVKVKGRDDLLGVDIEKVTPSSPAALSHIYVNETITEVNGIVINSYCDFVMALGSSEIGASVELKVANGSSLRFVDVKVGAREVHTINYNYCDEEPVQQLGELKSNIIADITSFPNPTRSTSYVQFNSSSEEDVIFHVMDIQGHLIYKEVFSDFNGELRTEYTFDDESNGTYLMVMQQGEETYKSKVHLIKQ